MVNKKNILLVEDNMDDVFLIKQVLPEDIYNIEVLHTGLDAYKRLKDWNNIPDVILFDYNLPKMNALEVMDKLQDRISYLAIIFLTVDTTIDTAVEAMKMGALDFLPKHKGYDEVPMMIEKVNQIRKMRIEKEMFQEALKKSEERYRSIFDNVQDAYFEMREDGTILEITPSITEILHYSRTEMIGRNLKGFFVSIDNADILFERLKTLQMVNQHEVSLKTKENEIVICSMNIKCKGCDEKPEKIGIGTIRDISEYRKLENMFRQSQKMEAIGRLAGGISHDFNNLLTVMIASTELALKKLAEKQYVEQKLHTILKTSEKAKNLTRNLLLFSKKKHGNTACIDLNTVLKQMENILKAMVGDKVVLKIVTEEKRCILKIDPVHLEQVILNLVSNAHDAMPNGGTIAIQVAHLEIIKQDEIFNLPTGWYVNLVVRDSGEGMTPQVQEHIFEPFYTTKKEKGTGLGLSTVYGIIKQAGGAISIDSQEGSGTTFSILLPSEFNEKQHVEDNIDEKELPQGSEKILLVEDDLSVREAVHMILTVQGYMVTDFDNAYDALKLLQEDKTFNLLCTDVVMQGMNGVELACEVAKIVPDMKILFMSGFENAKFIENDIFEHSKNFLEKPFNAQLLTEKVRSILDD